MLYVIARIDPAARKRITRMRQLAVPFGIAPREVHGHITLAGYTGGDEGKFVSSCKTILSGYGKFSVRYDEIKLFASTSAIVAAPRKDGALDAIQREISNAWEAGLNEWTRREVWQPHTTVAYHPTADLEAITEIMREEFEPFTAEVSRIEFSREYDGRYEIIDFIELS